MLPEGSIMEYLSVGSQEAPQTITGKNKLSLKAHICQICKADFSSDWSKQKPEHWLMAKAITNKVLQTVRPPFILSAMVKADKWQLKLGDFTA